MIDNYYTRGNGLLEGILAKKRAEKADSLIEYGYRKGRVLDVGCGSYPYFLINTTGFKKKYGIDPSLKSRTIKGLTLNSLDITAQKLPFKKDFFDAVTMLAVFEHIDYEKLDFVLEEIRRVLKKDGILVITTPSPWSDKLLHQMSKLRLISSEEIHEHKHHYARWEIKDIIKKSGFHKNNINSGYFEFCMNMWFTARK